MRHHLLLSGLLILTACSSPAGERVSSADLARLEAQERQTASASAESAAKKAEELRKERLGLDKREEQLARRREDHARNQEELESKRERNALDHASAEASEAIDLEKAERELRLAQEDLQHFVDVEMPRRLAEDALGLRGSYDNLLETREELAQLEMMYGESTLGDATEEIVLNRSRRRLERAEESYRLREERSLEVRERSLPREREKLELEVRVKSVALQNVQRKLEKNRLARAADLRGLDVEALKLERELRDMDRDAELLALDVQQWQRKSDESSSGGSVGS
jgi:hypothetical protein